MILTYLFIILGSSCYWIRELYFQGKLKWQKEDESMGFWGKHSDRRKYAYSHGKPLARKNNWYYDLNDLDYREKFLLSGTLLVFTTDGIHFTQFLMLLFFALAFIPLGWVTVVVTWVLMHAVKFVVNKILLK